MESVTLQREDDPVADETSDAFEDAAIPRVDADSFVKERIELLQLISQLCDSPTASFDAQVASRIKFIVRQHFKTE